MHITISLILATIIMMVPATPDTPANTCPVTMPGTERPAPNQSPFADHQAVIHEDGVWVSVPLNGVITLRSDDEILFSISRGYRADEHTWLRDDGVEGFILISGMRLDQPSELMPRNAVSPQRQYLKTGAVEASIAFPSAGCWEVTASVGAHHITWVVDVRFVDEATPAP